MPSKNFPVRALASWYLNDIHFFIRVYENIVYLAALPKAVIVQVMRTGFFLALICLVTTSCAASALDGAFPAIREAETPEFQQGLERAVSRLNLQQPIRDGRLAIMLMDISNPNAPRVAGLNTEKMMYAASLPKIAILFGLFKRIEEGTLKWDSDVSALAADMIHNSSNTSATLLYYMVGPLYIEDLLTSPKYNLYDSRRGGLWMGKEYGPGPAWKREPLLNLAHAATPSKVAHFYYLLETGQLVSKELAEKMKDVMSYTNIPSQFVKGLSRRDPSAVLYRKSGRWGNFNCDSALIEHGNKKYIAVALANDKDGARWNEELIVAFDELVLNTGSK